MAMRNAAFCLLCGLISPWAAADNVADPELPHTMSLTYVAHPAMESVLLPVIRSAYQNLGIDVDFMAVEAERGLRLLQDGMIDGDVARTGQVLVKLDNVITVTKLDELKLELHCRPGIQCKIADLTNPGVLLFFPESARTISELNLQITAQKYHVRDWSQLVQLYRANKVDRFLWISSSLTCINPVANTSIVAILAEPIELFHVLHKSQSALKDPLKVEIDSQLAALKASGCR